MDIVYNLRLLPFIKFKKVRSLQILIFFWLEMCNNCCSNNHYLYLKKGFLLFRNGIQRHKHLICWLVNQHGMPVAKGPPSNILSTESNMVACGVAKGNTDKTNKSYGPTAWVVQRWIVLSAGKVTF